MNHEVRELLHEIVRDHGPFTSSSEDMARCRGLLLDLAGHSVLEVNLLLHALRGRIPEELTSSNTNNSYSAVEWR